MLSCPQCLSNPILARRVVLLTPSKFSHPKPFLSQHHFAPISPLDATLTKNTGWGYPQLSPSSPLSPIFSTLFQVPYPAIPLFATLTKTPGVGGILPVSERGDARRLRQYAVRESSQCVGMVGVSEKLLV